MGFLHKLWDETLAGPTPDTGLGKLRKYNSFSASRPPPMNIVHDDVPVSRTITILRSNSTKVRHHISVDPGSAASESPTGSSTPGSPLSPGTPTGHFKKYARRKSSGEALQRAESRR